ncbi:tRNA (adenosine(37)-N6)-threonylcarbamoyltransferase complex ATPase subunit type 1 TsaE [Ilumatobacter sp.]|uniref:tRNA (adenosine(37)-N6)-threonylcarbamoyltransferase complex ATPase subunit type 1 TsaE n=1 Tax=Ilumatobacter sp. TaxID=1967498 RepID=UPI003AF800C8
MLLRAESLAGTHSIAATVASLARAGDVIVLAGDMGAGKTAFAQGFGRALGITEPITSPTFTLVHSYPVPGRRLTLHHADLYRLDRTGDIDDLALAELAEFDGIVLIEWGDVAGGAIGDHLEVRLGTDHDDEFADLDDDGDDDGDEADGDDDEVDDVDGDDDRHDHADFGLDEQRVVELAASGPGWAGRWDRLVTELAGYRC